MTSSLKILTVDDSIVSRMLIISIIKNTLPDAQILEAKEGQSALAIIASENPDLVILDMNMPGITGVEVATEALKTHPNIKMALLTANIQESVQQKAEKIGLQFFRKPVNERVIAQILALLGG